MRLLCVSLFLGLGEISLFRLPLALGAERVNSVIADRQVSVPIADVEKFAQTGAVSRQFAPLAIALGEPTLTQLRALLLERVPTGNPTDFQRVMSIPLTEPLLKNMSKALRSPSGADVAAVRTAINQAAADQTNGLTLLNVLHQFPGDAVDLDVVYTIKLVAELTALINYRDAAVKAVMQESEQEAANEKSNVTNLPDLRKPGPFQVGQKSLTFKIQAYRQTKAGLVRDYAMPVDLYLPEGLQQPAPLVIMSHGFGANRDAYAYLAKHLASYGFAVAAPQHVGSDLQYRGEFLDGKLNDIVTPREYISRSLDITYLLNELEQLKTKDPELAAKLNLHQVGVTGNSLGGTTALSVAGAPLNFSRLRQDCNDDRLSLSPSFLVQCVAQNGAQANADLGDRRIKAVLAAYPLVSSIFGPESMGKLTVPTLIVSGSNDVFAPPVPDQIHPFLWLKTPDKYLVLLQPGTHFSSSADAHVSGFPKNIVGVGLDVGRGYLEALSVAFFKTYLGEARQRSDYLPYLSAAYARSISRPPLQLNLIQSLTPTQLEQAYGKKAPIPIFPGTVVEGNGGGRVQVTGYGVQGQEMGEMR